MNKLEWLIVFVTLLASSFFTFAGCRALTGNFAFAVDISIAFALFGISIVAVIDSAIDRLNATLERLGNR